MTTAAEPATDARGRPCPGDLAEVVDIILDKGLVIDAYVRVSLLGLELLTIDARVVVASIDTYLRFAEAVNRLDLSSSRDGPPELAADTGPGRGETKTRQAAQAAREDETTPAQQHRQQQTKE